jgi:hypothetical protein
MGFLPLGMMVVVMVFGLIESTAKGTSALGAEVSFLGFFASLLDFCCPLAILKLLDS